MENIEYADLIGKKVRILFKDDSVLIGDMLKPMTGDIENPFVYGLVIKSENGELEEISTEDIKDINPI